MDAYIDVNGESFDAYKGGYTYYWLESDDPDESHGKKMEIKYEAEGGYGRVKCGIQIGYKDGSEHFEYIYDYDPEEDRYGAEYTISSLDNVLIVMVFIDSNYEYEDDFDGKFKLELALYKERLEKGSDDDDEEKVEEVLPEEALTKESDLH